MGIEEAHVVPLYRAMYLGEKGISVNRNYMVELELFNTKKNYLKRIYYGDERAPLYVHEFNPKHFRETVRHMEVFSNVNKRIAYIESIISDMIRAVNKDSVIITVLELWYVTTETILKDIILDKYKDFKEDAISDPDTELSFIINTIKHEVGDVIEIREC